MERIDRKSVSVKVLLWMQNMLKSFETTKEALANTTMLHHLVRGASPTALTSDASDTALGAVLEQRIRGVSHRSHGLTLPLRN